MKKTILKILFFLWLPLSFILIYYLVTDSYFWSWRYFSRAFLYYLIFFQPISTLGIAYILTKGKLSQTKSKIRPIFAVSVILIVFAFTMLQWAITTTDYCQYGSYCKRAGDYENHFLIPYGADTNYEKATLYREAHKNVYDLVFKKIWTFGLFMFVSTFLLLYSLKNKGEDV